MPAALGGKPRPATSPRAAGGGSQGDGDGMEDEGEQQEGQHREAAGEGGGALPAGLAGPAAEEAARARARELARVIDGAVCRMRALGAPAFFGPLEDGARPAQQQWFALTAWNAAQEAGRGGHVQPAAALLACAGDVLAALPEPDAPSLQRCRTAYVMAAAAVAETLQTATEEQVKRCRQRLQCLCLLPACALATVAGAITGPGVHCRALANRLVPSVIAEGAAAGPGAAPPGLCPQCQRRLAHSCGCQRRCAFC